MASTITSNPVSDIARALMQRFDTDNDGRFNASEFTALLTNLLSGSSPSPSARNSVPLQSAVATPAFDERLTRALASPPRSAMEGFNFDKIQNRDHETLKYRFARVAWQADLSSVHDKAGAERLLNSMKPDLEASGLKVVEIKGDKIRLLDDDGRECVVDVIRGAERANPAFQWLPS